MSDKMLTSCTRCGFEDVMTTLEALVHDDACRRRKGIRREDECPIHFQSDCSPLLNGCARLTAPT